VRAGWAAPAVLLGSLALGGCSIEQRAPRAVARATTGGPHVVPMRFPSDSEIPGNPLGAAIRRGRAILLATRDSLPAHVGNKLRCASCHMDAGLRAHSSPWVGVYGQFPQYRSRSGAVISLEDRINGCFERSMNGKALPPDSRAMRDILAYYAFLSRYVPIGAEVEGQGFRAVPPHQPDTAAGRALYEVECARCHGADGAGTPVAPPLWGDSSYNIGAGMARIRTAASFLRYNMPLDRPGELTDQQAYDLAAYINSQPRPDFPGKENDWPLGDPPPDVAYPTRAAAGRAAPRTP
jgi:thiosulfate dehydrogenase